MPDDKIDVRYVANLARLELTDAEVQSFEPQLNAILEHVKMLSEATFDDEEKAPLVALANMRDDSPGRSLDSEKVLANSPDSSQQQIRVPKVVADA